MTHTESALPPRNQSVDTFRFLAALAIIILHVEYPNVPREISIGLRLMSRWAIPFFFIMSGYFLAAGHERKDQWHVQPIVERLIWIFLLWALIYAPVIIDQHDTATLFKRITTPTFIYFGDFLHLWFISSLIFGYLFIAFCIHFNLKSLLPVLSMLIVIIALISGAYPIFDPGFPLEFDIARHWLSIPFLYIGILLFQKGRPSWWISILLISFGAVLQIFEVRFLYDKFGFSPYDHQFLIGTLPFAVGMACLALGDFKILQYPLFSKWGNTYSLGIYLIHPLISYIFSKTASPLAFGIMKNAIWQVLFPFILLSLCIIPLSLIRRYLPFLFNILFGRHIHNHTTGE